MKIMRILINFYLFSSIFISTMPALAEEVSCVYCGMDKAKFGYSWVVIVHEDSTKVELCSLHCAAIHIALHTHKAIDEITVGDYITTKQIDADTAHWVIGGDKLGVMTARAKWAFETKNAADEFMEKHGGRPATFKEVIKAAFEDMYEDTIMIQKKRKIMKMMRSKPQN